MGSIRTHQRAAAQRERRFAWSRGVRWLVSAGLVLHLMGVFAPPFAFQTSPVRGLGSPLAEAAMQWLRPYIELTYLNHGYAFFAPDPGPSHLLIARLEYDDGRPAEEVRLPDLEQHWPRLLYHRHFMLSEHFHNAFVPPQPPDEVRAEPLQLENWRRARALYEARLAALENYLRQAYGADRVTLRRVRHRLLDPLEFLQQGKRPADADTYLEMPETELQPFGPLDQLPPRSIRPPGVAGERGP